MAAEPVIDVEAILEWNDRDANAVDLIERVWALSMDYHAVKAEPRLGRLWNDARRWLSARGHYKRIA